LAAALRDEGADRAGSLRVQLLNRVARTVLVGSEDSPNAIGLRKLGAGRPVLILVRQRAGLAHHLDRSPLARVVGGRVRAGRGSTTRLERRAVLPRRGIGPRWVG